MTRSEPVARPSLPCGPDELRSLFLFAKLSQEQLNWLCEHGRVEQVLSRSNENAETVLDRFEEVGVDIESLAERLQQEGIEAFTTSWNELMSRIESKAHALEGAAGPAHS